MNSDADSMTSTPVTGSPQHSSTNNSPIPGGKEQGSGINILGLKGLASASKGDRLRSIIQEESMLDGGQSPADSSFLTPRSEESSDFNVSSSSATPTTANSTPITMAKKSLAIDSPRVPEGELSATKQGRKRVALKKSSKTTAGSGDNNVEGETEEVQRSFYVIFFYCVCTNLLFFLSLIFPLLFQ